MTQLISQILMVLFLENPLSFILSELQTLSNVSTSNEQIDMTITELIHVSQSMGDFHFGCTV